MEKVMENLIFGFITLRSKGQFDVSIEGPPLAGLIWKSLLDFSVLLPAFLEFLS
jgi:hypothetical protein